MKRYYPPVRSLHLYVGLFLSPFVLIFCLSVLALNHAGWLNRESPVEKGTTFKTKIDQIPLDTPELNAAKAILSKLKIEGEIEYIFKSKDRLSFPVSKPGMSVYIDVNTSTKEVAIRTERQGTLRAMNFLHKMPGQHNAKIRGNTPFLKIWRILSDSVVYLLLFLSASGVFLWYFLKVERKIGVFSMVLGAVTFAVLIPSII